MSSMKSFLVITTLLVLASFIAWKSSLINNTRRDTININDFPKQIGGWSSSNIPLSKLDLEVLGTDNVFVRRYNDPLGNVIYLYIAYSQTNRNVTHPPEICYAGWGISILENTSDKVTLRTNNTIIKVKRLLLKKGYLSQFI